MPEMSFCAGWEMVDGRRYWTSFMHLYVSFRSRVSKGGLPHTSVYLKKPWRRNAISSLTFLFKVKIPLQIKKKKKLT